MEYFLDTHVYIYIHIYTKVSSLVVVYSVCSHCNALQRTATHCNALQHTAAHSNALQHTATHCNTLQHTATLCNTLQHTATHCNTLQHTATHCNMVADLVLHHTLHHTLQQSSNAHSKLRFMHFASALCFCRLMLLTEAKSTSCHTYVVLCFCLSSRAFHLSLSPHLSFSHTYSLTHLLFLSLLSCSLSLSLCVQHEIVFCFFCLCLRYHVTEIRNGMADMRAMRKLVCMGIHVYLVDRHAPEKIHKVLLQKSRARLERIRHKAKSHSFCVPRFGLFPEEL